MAQKGTKKYLSVQHEDYLASLFDGQRSRSSGAAETDAGDVRSKRVLVECKMTGGPNYILSKPAPRFVQDFEKIANEAWSEGRDPVLALRYYLPHSVLAGKDGWVDLTLMLATDMAERERAWNESNGD